MFLISQAFAEEAAKAAISAESTIMQFVPLVAIFTIFYFLIIRPQVKKQQHHQKMVSELKKGDKVIAAGGIFGKIVKIEEKSNEVEIEIAPNTNITVLRMSVSEITKN